MRDIRFRSWNGKRMLSSEHYHSLGEFFGDINCKLKYPDGEALMMFTGLYDKNKKPIFEGDILNRDKPTSRHFRRATHDYYIVQYRDAKFVCECYNGNVLVHPDLKTWLNYEVIGDIYTTPELLKDKK